MTADDIARILSNVVGFQPQVYMAIHDPVTSELIGGPWESVQVFLQNPALGTGKVVILSKSASGSDVWSQLIEDLFNVFIAIPGIADLILKAVGPAAASIAQVIIERYGWGPGGPK